MTLLEARIQGRLADAIFFPPSIHPDLRAMFNPEYLRRFGRDGKRKRTEDGAGTSPKKARIAEAEPVIPALEEEGFGDGGFGDNFGDNNFGDGGFGDGGFGDDSFNPPAESPAAHRHRTVSPSLIDDDAQGEDEEAPTSVTGSMSHSTVAAAQLLQKELKPSTSATLAELTRKNVGERVKRDDAVKMFFEVLVLASRDVIRVRQDKGFGEVHVMGKEGLFKAGGFGNGQQILV
jgi:cohesin complex subunit SCC1